MVKLRTCILLFVACLSASAYGQWKPTVDTYLHNNETVLPTEYQALRDNPHLHNYWHVTSNYFFDKPYPLDADGDRIWYYSPQRFTEQLLNNSVRLWKRDEPNYPWRMRSTILDLEHFRIESDPRNRPGVTDEIQQYKGMIRLWRGTGMETAVFGIGPGAKFFQACWNYSRYTQWLDHERFPNRIPHERYDRKKQAEYKQKLTEATDDYKRVIATFNDEVDAWVVTLYMPYFIPDLDSWQWQAWLYYAQQKIIAPRQFSGKPVYVFVQPNYTARSPGHPAWEPVQREVWDAWLTWLYDTEERKGVDRIYIFCLERQKEQEEGWIDIVVNGPDGE